MEKETAAQMFNQRMDEWLKQKKILDAQEPELPSLRLNLITLVVLDEDSEGIWVKCSVNTRSIHIDKRAAIDMAHFIFELFGDKYSPD
jgi:hypothetical protein